MIKAKRLYSRLLAVILCLAIAVSLCGAISFAHGATNEDTGVYTDFTDTDLNLANGNFANSSGSSAPYTADSWTGGGLGGSSTGGQVSGIVKADNYGTDSKDLKLKDYYDEFRTAAPTVPDRADSDKNILMINSYADGKQAYGFTSSSSLSFGAGKFYKVSAYVRTSNFATGTGAAIRLNGLDEDVAVNNINTVRELENDGLDKTGWSSYNIYVATSYFSSSDVTVSLQLGDSYENSDGVVINAPADGYVFFDKVQAHEISPATFMEMVDNNYANENNAIFDLRETSSDEFVTGDYSADDWNFTSADSWTPIGNSNTARGVYDGASGFSKENPTNFYFDSDPASSMGKYDNDAKIYVISSKTSDTSAVSTYSGVESKEFTVQRYAYYRISVWVNAQDVSGGDGVTLTLFSERNNDEDDNLNVTITSCSGESANESRAGWNRYSFYVKGSVIKDHTAALQLSLGTASNNSQGIAMFDNITIERILPSEYNTNSANGTVADFDSHLTFSTTVGNGRFYNVGEYEDFEFPMVPAEWSRYDVTNVGTTGFSTSDSFVGSSYDNIIGGIIPTGINMSYSGNDMYKILADAGVIAPPTDNSSVLMLHSADPTAFCYRSPAITATASTPLRISVSLYVNNIDGYGANLVLKSGNNVIATIEKIKSTSGFQTYDFYVNPGSADISDLTVEIWLGLNDRKDNNEKKASGTVYVSEVTANAVNSDATAAATDFAAQLKTYNDAKRNGANNLRTVAYDFTAEDFGAFDAYDKNFVKTPYNWTLTSTSTETTKYGIFDWTRTSANQSDVPGTFEDDKDVSNYGILMLKNTVPAYSSLQYRNSFSLSADLYYTLSVKIKVNISPNGNTGGTGSGAGARVFLTDTTHGFSNILSTSEQHDTVTYNEVFQTYTFYINPGATATTVGLTFSLGDTGLSNYSTGTVYVTEISLLEINSTAYDNAIKTIEDSDDPDSLKILKAELATSGEEDGDGSDDSSGSGNDGIHWMLIPGILFGVAILIAVIGVAVRKIIEKRSKKKHYEKVVSYDRKETLNKEHNKNAADENEKLTVTEADDETYDTFNDDLSGNSSAKAEPKAASPAEQDVQQQTADGDAEKTEKSEEPTEEKATDEQSPAETTESAEQTEPAKQPEQPESEEKEKKPEPSDPYIDSFDD